MRTTWIIALSLALCLAAPAGTARAQEMFLDHEPLLNWDFVVPGMPVDGLGVVVPTPGWAPHQVAADPLVPSWGYDGNEPITLPGGDGTRLRWRDDPGPLGEPVIHAGADMTGSGGIVDAYWMLGDDIVLPLPIIWEITRVFPEGTPDAGLIQMGLQTTESAAQAYGSFYGGSSIKLRNVRTWVDIPADALDLPDINRTLDEATVPGTPAAEFDEVPIDTEMVFLDLASVPDPQTLSPEFESLLTAEIWAQLDPFGPPQRVGTFWNLNPQSPEPASLALLAFGGCLALLRKRK